MGNEPSRHPESSLSEQDLSRLIAELRPALCGYVSPILPIPPAVDGVADGSTFTHAPDAAKPRRFYRIKAWLENLP